MQDGLLTLPKLFIDNPDLAQRALYDFSWPMACFDSIGNIICANSVFCSLTGLSHDDITSGAAPIDKYVNMENTQLRDGVEKITGVEPMTFSNLVSPLFCLPDTDGNKYTEAILYSLAENDTAGGYYCFIFKEKESARASRRNN